MARRSEEREWKRPCGREGESRRRRGAAEGGRRAEREGAKEARDVLLDAAVRVVSDTVTVLKTDAALAARARPGSVVAPD